MTRPIYGLDIETDNSSGNGLNPAMSTVASIALVGSDGSAYFSRAAKAKHGEEELLDQFRAVLAYLPEDAIIATWNGGAFDFPFLTVRMEANFLTVPWKLEDREDRTPKYEPTPPFKGVCRVTFKRKRTDHHDVAYSFDRSFCELAEVKWSLKPMLDHWGVTDPDVAALGTHATDASQASAPRLAAYNTHDAWGTLQLAALALHHVGPDNYKCALDSYRPDPLAGLDIPPTSS